MLDTLRLLRPYHVPGIYRQRLPFAGHDGGYVVPIRECIECDVFYCLGISDHSPFEEALSRHLPGKAFRLYDMEEPRNRWWDGSSHVRFFRKRFGGGGDRLADCIAEQGDLGKRIMLKLDVEGAEWDLFESLDDSLLDQMEVIVAEFHELDRPHEQERYQAVFRKLNSRFTLIHLHGNNFGGEYQPSGDSNWSFPRTLELTYVHSRHVSRRTFSSERFPTAIDFPNDPGQPDYEIAFPPEWSQPALPAKRFTVALALALPGGEPRGYQEEASGGGLEEAQSDSLRHIRL